MKITSNDREWQPQYFVVISSLFCGIYMITIAISPKLVDLWGVIVPAGILTFPICAIIADLMTEVYGFNRTRQAIWVTLVCGVLFAILGQAAIALPPPAFWQHQAAFEAIFNTTWRLAIGGCLAWVVGEFVNSYIVSKMKVMQNANFMSVRFVASTIVGQFFDTAIVLLIAFAGTMPWDSFFVMFLSAWSLKVLYEVVALPLSLPLARKLKQIEGVEHFDRQTLRIV